MSKSSKASPIGDPSTLIDRAPDGFGSALSFFSDEAFRFYLPAYLIADSVTAQLEDAAITAQKSFAVPGRIGIDAVQFRLPDGAHSGGFKVTVNGQDSNTITLPVQ